MTEEWDWPPRRRAFESVEIVVKRQAPTPTKLPWGRKVAEFYIRAMIFVFKTALGAILGAVFIACLWLVLKFVQGS